MINKQKRRRANIEYGSILDSCNELILKHHLSNFILSQPENSPKKFANFLLLFCFGQTMGKNNNKNSSLIGRGGQKPNTNSKNCLITSLK